MAEPEPPGDGPRRGPAEDRFLADLADWAAGQRVAGAASGRARLRALTESAAGSATLVGILVDLAERRAEVSLTVRGPAPAPSAHPVGSSRPFPGPARLTGRLVGVGRDFCVLDRASAGMTVVGLAAVTSVWPAAAEGGGAPAMPAGARPAPLALSLVAVLAELAASGATVALGTESGVVEGALLSVGEDVLTVGRRAGARPTGHLPVAAVQWCEVR